ncbi:hypothetical protein SprV_0200733300 [Sparganum proliferum]
MPTLPTNFPRMDRPPRTFRDQMRQQPDNSTCSLHKCFIATPAPTPTVATTTTTTTATGENTSHASSATTIITNAPPPPRVVLDPSQPVLSEITHSPHASTWQVNYESVTLGPTCQPLKPVAPA